MIRGFSLVELSIVLVILGLLTGGILTGQSLIHAAELRAVTTEYERYAAAIHTFRDKYMAIPGDMRNATSFWGDDNAACPDAAVANGAPGTCNGGGNGAVGHSGVVSTTGEMHQLWKQLALAGLIEGTYTGLAGPGAGNPGSDTIPGTNAPLSRYGSRSGWAAWTFTSAGDAYSYTETYGNMFAFGVILPGNIPINPVMKPEDAWGIDMKMDDGKPARGRVMIRSYYAWGTANACSTSTSSTDYAGEYKLTVSTDACSFFFKNAF